MTQSHSAVCWSAVCNYGISSSYSLTFYNIMANLIWGKNIFWILLFYNLLFPILRFVLVLIVIFIIGNSF